MLRCKLKTKKTFVACGEMKKEKGQWLDYVKNSREMMFHDIVLIWYLSEAEAYSKEIKFVM